MAEEDPGQPVRTREGASKATTPSLELITVYRAGHTDGYAGFFGGPLYRSLEEADAAAKLEHGPYAIPPERRQAIELPDGTIYLIDGGPQMWATGAMSRRALRQAALNKLTADERALLKVSEEDEE